MTFHWRIVTRPARRTRRPAVPMGPTTENPASAARTWELSARSHAQCSRLRQQPLQQDLRSVPDLTARMVVRKRIPATPRLGSPPSHRGCPVRKGGRCDDRGSGVGASPTAASAQGVWGCPQGQRKGTPCVPGSPTPGAYGHIQPKPTNRSRQAALMIGRLPPRLQTKLCFR